MKWLTDRLFKRDFVKLTIDGASCVMPPLVAIHELSVADNPKQYTAEIVRLTYSQYERLGEFQGW